MANSDSDPGFFDAQLFCFIKERSGKDYAVRSQAGFSLTELLVVVAIILVVSGVSVPTISRAVDNARLKYAAQQVADIYQQARIRAAQDNSYHEVLVTPATVIPAQLCLDLDDDGVCGPGEPATVLPAQVQLMNSGVPAALDAGTLGFAALNNDTSSSYNQQNKVVHGLAWNASGLPCQRTSPNSACIATGWVQYLQLQRSVDNTSYVAVSVSPTGRIKVWTYSGGNGGLNWY